MFTLQFCSLFLWMLWNHKSWRTLLWLPAIEVLWVNLHIGFIFGPVFAGAFVLEELLRRGPALPRGVSPWQTEFYKEKAALLTRWLGILALTVLATLLNPSGIYGGVYPFTIWSNWGIDVKHGSRSLCSFWRCCSARWLGLRFAIRPSSQCSPSPRSGSTRG